MTAVRKRFGQHFLETAWVRKLVEAIGPGPDDVFLEIGPGRGALTFPLAAAASRVIAIEIDRDLAAGLTRTAPPNVTVLTGDVLAMDLWSVLPDGADAPVVRAAGNLPYNISSPILFALIAAHARDPRLRDATLMLQREVADRLSAKPGTGDYGVLSVFVQRRADVRRVLDLPPGAFRPPPKVHSAVVRLDFRRDVAPAPPNFESLVRGVFTHRRKTMANALAAFARLSNAEAAALLHGEGVDPVRRPETLTIDELIRIANRLAAGPRKPGAHLW
jgi:16S rRNA (adenine1518-N6/adenine1519-N6)-dimethyltransferase